MKRCFDFNLSLLLILAGLIPACILALLVIITSNGPALFWSNRMGRKNKIFQMPKFRTMYLETPIIATDLLKEPSKYLTPVGVYLRKSSLDELPQLWSILKGDMSFVGPRPALFNQTDLIELRKEYGIDILTPGLTGWAQINGRDNLSDIDKVKFDFEYLKKQSLKFDLKILLITIIKVLKSSEILH